MKKILFLIAGLTLSMNARAELSLKCEGWFQKDGAELKRNLLVPSEQTNLNWKQSVIAEGYTYKVNWDVNLDAIYTEIYRGDVRVLYTTARVPTFPHNDSFTDMKIPGGPRLAISCEFKQ